MIGTTRIGTFATRIRSILAAATLLSSCVGAHAGDARILAPHGQYRMQITSLKEARFRTTVAQQYDFSCGSAATATLLTWQYDTPVSEKEVFVQMYRRGDQAKIRKQGFSLLDMRLYLESIGFQADGFELPLDKLLEEGLPAIVLLNDRGYRHFVVVKGLRDGRILLGDPARGTRTMSRSRFDALWDNGILFVVHNRRELARFNQSRDWATAPPAPLASGVSREGLRNITMPRRGPGDI